MNRYIHSSARWPHRLAGLIGALCVAHASAAVDPLPGARVDGSANQYGLVCGTCNIDVVNFPPLADGGPGSAWAAVNSAAAGYAFAGTASFAGPNALPTVGAYAFADIIIDSSIPKTFFHEASVFSQALQRYDYSGSTSQDYVIHYTVSGNFTLDRADPVSLMQAYGGLTIFGAGYDPGAEVNPILDFDYVGENASEGGTRSFSLSGSVGFTVNPGDHFYVWGNLFALADSSHTVTGSVDAMHTLTMRFASGDTALLTPQVTAVPEPTSSVLMLVGLLAAGVWARQRHSASTRKISRP